MARSSSLIYCEEDLIMRAGGNAVKQLSDKSLLGKMANIMKIQEIYLYWKVFGLKLYRGFPVYLSAIGLWHYYVPSAAKYKY
eukprot:CAMPEP_0170515090 /NCGR_PEP_ID=MMETSP0209-20121228/1573_1 /TAXON_ID=665100 ORGANISM="Litonotus pictus, Strain P1" /NCGR_SAMPLE_ID=MMETSP0209 /ASSEMBLY_ACC=CAM_ASM_000301 /LENGTH=81 /DNA_ID=CAMNT_0010799425 /DNA_START=734 /DNA_END=976 /DNA_ORIENTATION=+